MCGIFGVFAKPGYKEKSIKAIFTNLALLSESRGKESSGFVFRDDTQNEIRVIKAAVSIKELIKTNEFLGELNQALKNYKSMGANSVSLVGHSRLVTNGAQSDNNNNQPVIKEGIVGVHNGIIVNDQKIWKKNSGIKKEYDIDTEVLLALTRHYIDDSIDELKPKIFSDVFDAIEGTIATCLLFNDYNISFLGTNNGSLYLLTNESDLYIFASEKFILNELVRKNDKIFSNNFNIKQIKTNNGIIIDLKSFISTRIELKSLSQNSFDKKIIKLDKSYLIKEIKSSKSRNSNSSIVDLSKIASNSNYYLKKSLLEYNINEIEQLKRCTKCLLPETFPFIVFNNQGVCNYCLNYNIKSGTKSHDELLILVDKYRSKDKSPDCLIPFSGGRDSSFVVHYVAKELKMNPVTLTYDWGMVTDLARRNIARVCGKLGVENIIVSADINWKRENIRKNISAWLKRPELGMIPLFMAGDKYFFYHTHKTKIQNNIKLNFWGINNLENTDFKVGFCGVKPNFNKERIYSLDFQSQMKLFSFIGKNLISNTSYLNQSIFDTLGSFFVRYFYPKKDYYHLFDYLTWNEKVIEETIISEYNWETAIDTKSTWRIGDGTASFYNYAYYTVAGFSENDTFRSNQIREGMITRENGLKLIADENAPRYETIKWYLDIIGLDFEDTIKCINKIAKLYRH